MLTSLDIIRKRHTTCLDACTLLREEKATEVDGEGLDYWEGALSSASYCLNAISTLPLPKTHIIRRDTVGSKGEETLYADTLRSAVLNLLSLHSHDCKGTAGACEADSYADADAHISGCSLKEACRLLSAGQSKEASEYLCSYGSWELKEVPCLCGDVCDKSIS